MAFVRLFRIIWNHTLGMINTNWQIHPEDNFTSSSRWDDQMPSQPTRKSVSLMKLSKGDVVSVAGDFFEVSGVWSYNSHGFKWKEYALKPQTIADEDTISFLEVEMDDGEWIIHHYQTILDLEEIPGLDPVTGTWPASVVHNDTTFKLQEKDTATAQAAGDDMVYDLTFADYRGKRGGVKARLSVEYYPSRSASGKAEIEIWEGIRIPPSSVAVFAD